MKKIVVFLAFIFLASFAIAQHKITLQLKVPNDSHITKYFFASNLNGWNPADTNYQFQRNSANEFVLHLPVNNVELIQYKITKGSWDAVESTISGEDISNRVIRNMDIFSDSTISITVVQWKNNVTKTRTSTASRNVKIINDKFLI